MINLLADEYGLTKVDTGKWSVNWIMRLSNVVFGEEEITGKDALGLVG